MSRDVPLRLLACLAAFSFPPACSDNAGPSEPPCPDEIPARPFDAERDATFPLGPYLMHTTGTSTTIMWTTEEECPGEVHLGLSDDELDRTENSEVDAEVHRARLTGLIPDTRYSYRVSACSKTSEVHRFYTAPEAGAPVRFTVWGDSRTDIEQCCKTVEAMALRHPHFDLHTGDVVTDGHEELQWTDEFLEPLRPLGHSVPTYVAIGNHEGNAEHFYRLTDYPVPDNLRNGPVWGSNYSFTYGNVFVLVFDTNNPFFMFANELESPLIEWIRQQMASPEAREATWRIGAAHEPAWSEGWSPGSCDGFDGNLAVRNWMMPLLAENDFHVFFAGHTHDYERGMADGVLQIITGGGGSSLDEWCRDFDEIEVVELAYHFVEVEAGCETMTLRAIPISEDPEPLDTVVLHTTDGRE